MRGPRVGSLLLGLLCAWSASGPAGTLAAPGQSGAPPEALASPVRRSPVVEVVEQASPAVVNVSTEQRVDNPFHRSGLDRFFQTLLDGAGPGTGPLAGPWVQNSLGSGVIVDPRGYILTNEHVLWRASRVRVTLSDRRTFESEVIGVDPRSDLAVLKIQSSEPLPAAKQGTSDDLMIGETVIAIGNPYGLSNTVTTGVVSAVRRSIRAGDRLYSDFVQTDASINPGNSGGALLNIRGELVGINTAIMGEGQGIGFAIPVDRARKVFEDLVRYGEVKMAWIGLDVRDLTDRTYAALAPPEDAAQAGGAISVPPPGVEVRRVYADSPAGKAGLRAGDLVVSLGSEPVTSRTDFETAVSRFKAGDDIEIAWRRGEAESRAALRATDFPVQLAEDYLADQVGLELSEIPAELRQRTRGLPPDGVVVTRVRTRSRAYFSGLEEGDVLRGIYDQPVADMGSLRQAVPRIVGRDAVLLKVVRGRYQYHVTVDLS